MSIFFIKNLFSIFIRFSNLGLMLHNVSSKEMILFLYFCSKCRN